MFGKILKLATGAAILGAGGFVSDFLFQKFVTPNLPDGFTNWVAASAPRVRMYAYGTQALGVMILLPLVVPMLGLSDKSPIKGDVSPLKG